MMMKVDGVFFWNIPSIILLYYIIIYINLKAPHCKKKWYFFVKFPFKGPISSSLFLLFVFLLYYCYHGRSNGLDNAYAIMS